MAAMLFGAITFDQDLNWYTNEVTSFAKFLKYAYSFDSRVNFDTTNAVSLSGMFHGAESFNQDVSYFYTPNVDDFSYMVCH